MFNITKQQLDYDKVNEYIAACPGYEHTKLVTTNDLLFDKDLYTYRYGERPNDGPMGFPVASYRDAEGHLCVTQTCYNHHTLTIATTGRGKTQGSVLNIAYNADKRCSYIFTDPKNEVCKMSYNFLKELYGEENIDIINFLDPKHSTAFFNPFTDLAYEWINAENMPNKEEIRSNIEGEIEKICEILYPINNSKDESWDMTGRSLVQAIFQGCFEDLNLDPITCAKTGRSRVEPEMINFKTVERIFHSITYDRLGVHDNGFFSSRDVTSKAYTMTYSILDAEIQKAQNQIVELLISKNSGQITDEEFNKQSQKLKFHIDELNLQKQVVINEQGKVQLAEYRADAITELLKSGKILEKFDKTIFKCLVHRIIAVADKEVEFEFECGIKVREKL